MGSTPKGSEDPCRLVANWTSIPSDLPSPARALLIQVNGANNDGGTTLTNSFCPYSLTVEHLTYTQHCRQISEQSWFESKWGYHL